MHGVLRLFFHTPLWRDGTGKVLLYQYKLKSVKGGMV
jgi:hypothetical protein